MRGRPRGPFRRQPEAVDLADDGIAGDADLGGDLAAGKSGKDKVAELRDALRSPGFDAHDGNGLVKARPVSEPPNKTKAARNRRPENWHVREAQNRCTPPRMAPRSPSRICARRWPVRRLTKTP